MIYNYSDIIKSADLQGKEQNKRYIYILLLCYPDKFSKIFCAISRCEYNHASIGLGDSDGTFYSYVTKGFRKETPIKYPTFKNQEVPCKLYKIEVPDETYDATKIALDNHIKQAHNFKYNFCGLMLCLLRIVFPIKNRYFCSQFVCEILEKIKAVPLTKHSSLYLPDDFTKMQGLDLCFSGFLSRLGNEFEPAI